KNVVRDEARQRVPRRLAEESESSAVTAVDDDRARAERIVLLADFGVRNDDVLAADRLGQSSLLWCDVRVAHRTHSRACDILGLPVITSGVPPVITSEARDLLVVP